MTTPAVPISDPMTMAVPMGSILVGCRGLAPPIDPGPDRRKRWCAHRHAVHVALRISSGNRPGRSERWPLTAPKGTGSLPGGRVRPVRPLPLPRNPPWLLQHRFAT